MINEVLQTIIVVIIALSSVFAVGFCFVTLAIRLFRITCTSEQIWAAAPLVGTGAIILICQNLLYLDIRIPYSALLIWAIVGLAGMISLIRTKSRLSFSNIPLKLIATGLGIYAIHASGLLVSGVSNYYGYGWGDMYNYVAQAQFFIDYPFNSTIDTHEYIRTAHFYKQDRIGQSVLHAFIASSSGADAQQTFGATILLSPMLLFFSLFLLSTRLGIKRRFAYPAAIIASLSPAVATVHLECFFSQAIAMPFIFIWPLAISRLQSDRSIYSIVVAGLLFAVTAAIYTEVIIPLTLISVIVLLVSFWRNGANNAVSSPTIRANRSWGDFFLYVFSLSLVIVIGLGANIGYFKGLIAVMGRTTASGILDYIYPWALRPEGLARLWIGHQASLPTGWLLYSLVFISAVLIFAAIVYALLLCRKNPAPGQLSSTLIVCMPLAPLLLSILTINTYPYQFFKLLLMVWPLILFFAVCGISEWLSRRLQGRGFIYFQVALVSISLVLTNRIVFASTKPETVANTSRGGAHLLIDDNFRQMRTMLDRLEGKQLYIWWFDKALYGGNWRGRWLAYYARKNDVWMFNPTPPSGGGGLPFDFLPTNAIKAPVIGISWKEAPVGTKEKIGSFLSGTDPFWVYLLADDRELHRLDRESSSGLRVDPMFRSMSLSIDKNTDPNTWYPLWVAGQPGAATFVTIQFGETVNRFRYDHWGYKATIMELGGKCAGDALSVTISVDQIKRKLSINCNGVLAQTDLVAVKTYLGLEDPLGVNNVTDALEGKYPLSKTFPGKIIEQPATY